MYCSVSGLLDQDLEATKGLSEVENVALYRNRPHPLVSLHSVPILIDIGPFGKVMKLF